MPGLELSKKKEQKAKEEKAEREKPKKQVNLQKRIQRWMLTWLCFPAKLLSLLYELLAIMLSKPSRPNL